MPHQAMYGIGYSLLDELVEIGLQSALDLRHKKAETHAASHMFRWTQTNMCRKTYIITSAADGIGMQPKHSLNEPVARVQHDAEHDLVALSCVSGFLVAFAKMVDFCDLEALPGPGDVLRMVT